MSPNRGCRPAAGSLGRRPGHSGGFTLIEVMISVILLSVILLSSGSFVGRLLHAVGTSTVRTVATQVANEHLAAIQAERAYPIPTSWAGTVTGFHDYPGMRRITTLNRVNTSSPQRDYTIVTVKVTEPVMTRNGTTVQDTVNVTAVVARP